MYNSLSIRCELRQSPYQQFRESGRKKGFRMTITDEIRKHFRAVVVGYSASGLSLSKFLKSRGFFLRRYNFTELLKDRQYLQSREISFQQDLDDLSINIPVYNKDFVMKFCDYLMKIREGHLFVSPYHYCVRKDLTLNQNNVFRYKSKHAECNPTKLTMVIVRTMMEYFEVNCYVMLEHIHVFLYIEECYRLYKIMKELEHHSYRMGNKYVNRLNNGIPYLNVEYVDRYEKLFKGKKMSEFEVKQLVKIIPNMLKEQDFAFFLNSVDYQFERVCRIPNGGDIKRVLDGQSNNDFFEEYKLVQPFKETKRVKLQMNYVEEYSFGDAPMHKYTISYPFFHVYHKGSIVIKSVLNNNMIFTSPAVIGCCLSYDKHVFPVQVIRKFKCTVYLSGQCTVLSYTNLDTANYVVYEVHDREVVEIVSGVSSSRDANYEFSYNKPPLKNLEHNLVLMGWNDTPFFLVYEIWTHRYMGDYCPSFTFSDYWSYRIGRIEDEEVKVKIGENGYVKVFSQRGKLYDEDDEQVEGRETVLMYPESELQTHGQIIKIDERHVRVLDDNVMSFIVSHSDTYQSLREKKEKISNDDDS